jgi:hypothetical protein
VTSVVFPVFLVPTTDITFIQVSSGNWALGSLKIVWFGVAGIIGII